MTFSKISRRSLVVAGVSVLLAGCGGFGKEITSPTPPAAVHGWQKYQSGSVTVQGEFVLHKGESSDNGQFGIRVMDTYPAKTHLLDSPEMPKAKIQFYRVKDQALICEGVFTRGSNSLTLPDLCNDRLPWSVIYVRDVNDSEKWVFLDLR